MAKDSGARRNQDTGNNRDYVDHDPKPLYNTPDETRRNLINEPSKGKARRAYVAKDSEPRRNQDTGNNRDYVDHNPETKVAEPQQYQEDTRRDYVDHNQESLIEKDNKRYW